jgi:hypothetical protein
MVDSKGNHAVAEHCAAVVSPGEGGVAIQSGIGGFCLGGVCVCGGKEIVNSSGNHDGSQLHNLQLLFPDGSAAAAAGRLWCRRLRCLSAWQSIGTITAVS